MVIPALAEAGVVATLDSLAAAGRPDVAVEILLVVNAACDAGPEIRQVNAQTLAGARAWAVHAAGRGFRCHVLDHRDLRPEQAGVGLARKLGLDAGLARLAATHPGRGILVSLDADCRVAPGYLSAVNDFFEREPQAVGATIHFEHPIDEAEPPLRQAIVEYELHLRCYRHGLAIAGSPYACYAMGSAFAVRSEVYAQEGGMNRRAAGEDFYFLNKLLKRGRVGRITDTAVYPAARVSGRVPFGTGAALRRSRDEPVTTYAPEVYRELQTFLGALETAVLAGRPGPAEYAVFLDSMGFDAWLEKTRANVASSTALARQLRRWCDGFRTMKFVNWVTGRRYPRVAVTDAAREILRWQHVEPAGDTRRLLEQFRARDRAAD